MKTSTLILFFCFFLNANVIYSQEFTLKASAGFAGVGSPFDGYYFSCDIGVPVTRGIEIAPTFTSCSDITHSEIYYNWDSYTNEVKTNINDFSDGYLASYYELFVLAKPLKWIDKPKSNKFDLGIGVGYGLKSFVVYNYSFIDDKLSGIIEKKGIRQNFSARGFINVNYEKYLLGLVLGAQDLSDEANSILGLQICVRIE